MILCAFALAIGSLTVHRLRSDFNREVSNAAAQLPYHLQVNVDPATGTFSFNPALQDLATPGQHAVIRILYPEGNLVSQYPEGAPPLGGPSQVPQTIDGYRVVSHPFVVSAEGVRLGQLWFQYARRVSDTEATVKRVELFLFLGVLAGSVFALLAGMAIARRAMAPVQTLTSTAAEIARTRDPSRRVPVPPADDEVGELARTLEGMLRELDAAREEREAVLARQRRFVADASHELRTPLTSVLANLEMLAESLHGDEGETARAALRSSQRMRRLVADLLLLARTDAARVVTREPVDLAQVVVEAAGELGALSGEHEISLDVQPVKVLAARDELVRLTLNLIENAIKHTPAGTRISVSTRELGAQAQLVVEDSGPGVPAEIAPTLFERFVRGDGDRGGSFGLGLAIVKAVAESHGGTVALEPPASGAGARFVVRLPVCSSDLDDDGKDHRPALEPVVDQLG